MICNWKLKSIAAGFRMSPKAYWNAQNGNGLSTVTEAVTADLVRGTKTGGQRPYDVISGPNHWASQIEVRNSFKDVSFAPSTSRGKGRCFDLLSFKSKLKKCDSFVVYNLTPLKRLQQPIVYEISSDLIKGLYDLGAIGATAHIDFHKRRRYPHGWEKRKMRFEELFPYEEFKFIPNSSQPSKRKAIEVLEAAITRINQRINNK